MNRRALFVVAIVAAQLGCAAVKPMTPDVAQTLKGKRVAFVARNKPDFTAMTAGKAMFGMFGAVAMNAAGNELVAKHTIEDPAVKMTRELVASLREKHGLVAAAAPVDPGEATNVYALAEMFPNEELLLDVQTTQWSFAYFPSDWSHYRVIYAVKASLYDLKNKQVLVSGAARRVPEKGPDSPTYEELMGSDAARLKADLKRLSDECFQEIQRDAFKL